MLLPWFSLDRSAMVAAFEPLAYDGVQRIYVDLPGVGQSPGGPATSDSIVEAVCEFVQAYPSALLAGCSYGGYLAAAVARRIPVDGLLLVCHGTKITFADRDLSGTGPELPDGTWLGGVPADLRTHLKVAVGAPHAAVAERVAGVIASAGSGDEDFLQRLRATGYRLSDEDAEVIFDGPTSIITGRNDRIAGYADPYRSLRNYPDATFTVVAGAGHYLPFERPDIFRSLVDEWLTRRS